jgi:hypothetical protein
VLASDIPAGFILLALDFRPVSGKISLAGIDKEVNLMVVVLVLVTMTESFRKRVGAPAALGLPYNREERT